MQKDVQFMVNSTRFVTASWFLNVGSGIEKPNLHVAQYPAVEFLCGVQIEYSQWLLGMTCLKACLKAVAVSSAPFLLAEAVQGNIMFLFNTIIKAQTFDPFTHM